MTVESTAPPTTPTSAPAAAAPGRVRRTVGRRGVRYLAVLAGAWLLAEAMGRIGVPAPALLAALLLGAVLRLAIGREVAVPAEVSRWTQAFIGVMLGGYLNVEAMRAVGPVLAPFLAVSVLTVVLSVGAAWVLSRWVADLDQRTATLGLMAGGSSAVVTLCDELGARKDVVGVMQYSRVLLVSATAPFVAVGLAGGATVPAKAWSLDLQIVGRGDQVAGLSTAIVFALAGMWLGRRLHLPGGGLIGPMLVAAVIGGAELTRGFAPQGAFKELLLIVVGLEVGLMVDRRLLRRLAHLLPAIAGGIVALCGVVALLAVAAARMTGVSVADAYLATTPGGINAVVASATGSSTANMALIATVQSLRLIIVVLALPLVVGALSRLSGFRAARADATTR
ncbi:AbrB family transcriptional regulator [Tsukamurella pseudospumae]|uniref:AbrB family transcriptional regulator n=1 Tax=Tsukamurella pseudospumae TaxID=239498 RepID=UPI0009EC751F|nr:AbrB family transcriptional regulator [Tsukamurella pseudospumae]